MKIGDRVELINPSGYPYRGTVIRNAVFIGKEYWDIQWDDGPYYPCYTPMNESNFRVLTIQERLDEILVEHANDVNAYLECDSVPLENYQNDIDIKINNVRKKIRELFTP